MQGKTRASRREWRPDRLRSSATGARRGPAGAALVVFILLAAMILAWQPMVLGADGQARERVIDLTGRRFEWDPGVIEVNRGDRVVLRVRAEDVTHGLYIDGYGIREEIFPGQVKEITFTTDRPGRFMFRCAVTCGTFHPYMTGWLRVRPNTNFVGGVTGVGLLVAGALGLLHRHKGRSTSDVHHA